jgi:prepilin-type N-terminal cleavage/methylation domain-containing protein
MKLFGKHGTAGFSFIETLTAIFILGILAAIAMPHFTKLLPGIRLSSAARQIATDLQLARMRAIAQHTNQPVTFDTSTATYTLGADTRNLAQLYPGTTITSVSAGNPTFNTTGTVAAATTITISNNSVTKQIQINAIGRVSIP